MLKTELEIIDLFRKDLFRTESIRGIMKKTNKKSYGSVFKSVKELLKKGVLDEKKQGKSLLCSINLENELTLAYLSFLESIEAYTKIKDKIRKNIQELISSTPQDYFSLILTGSYSEGKATKKSDLDIVVITEDESDVKKILNVLKNKGELMIPEVHPYVFKKSEFLEMLLNNEMNYGKLIFKDRIIFYGAQNYYRIIRNAIKNGFKV